MDLGLISLILVIIGLIGMPWYSAYVMEKRIKKYAEQFEIKKVTQAIIDVMEGLSNAGLIEAEKDG